MRALEFLGLVLTLTLIVALSIIGAFMQPGLIP
jgi:UPF0716 family protein affecting phage T7 exclusion